MNNLTQHMQEIKKDMYNLNEMIGLFLPATCHSHIQRWGEGEERRKGLCCTTAIHHTPQPRSRLSPVHPSSHLSSWLQEGTEAENGKHLPSVPRGQGRELNPEGVTPKPIL